MKAELTLAELELILTHLPIDIPINPAVAIVQSKIASLKTEDDQTRRLWNAYCGHFGLKPEHFGKRFFIKRTAYEITGVNPGASRFPIQAKRVPDGKQFRVPAASVRMSA